MGCEVLWQEIRGASGRGGYGLVMESFPEEGTAPLRLPLLFPKSSKTVYLPLFNPKTSLQSSLCVISLQDMTVPLARYSIHSVIYQIFIENIHYVLMDDGDTMVGPCFFDDISLDSTPLTIPPQSSRIHFPFLCQPRPLPPMVP